jgi:hypothetical protein
MIDNELFLCFFSLKNLLHLFSYREKEKRKYSFYEINSIKLFDNIDFYYDSPKNFNRNIHFDDKVCNDYLWQYL